MKVCLGVLVAWLATGTNVCLADDAGRVAVRLEERAGVARRQWPVTCGIPFARGVLRAEVVEAGHIQVLRPDGAPVPTQARVVASWGEYPWGPSRSVRWLWVTFLADTEPGQASGWAIEWGPAVAPPPPPVLRVERVVDAVAITNGQGPNEVMFVVNGADYRSLLETVVVDSAGNGFSDDIPALDASRHGRIEATCVGAGGTVSAVASGPADVRVMEKGPLRVVVGVEAPLGPDMSLVSLYTFHAGLPCVFVQVAVRPRVDGCAVTSCSASLPIEVIETADVTCGVGDALLPSGWGIAGTTVEPDKPVALEQTGPHDLSAAVKRAGDGFRSQFGRGAEVVNKGERAPGWMDVHFGARALMAACRDFWFSPSSRMTASSGELRIDLRSFGGRDAAAFARDFLLFFPYDRVAMPSDQVARAFAAPLVAAPSAGYLCSTQALAGTPLTVAAADDPLNAAGQILLQGVLPETTPAPTPAAPISAPERARALADLQRESEHDFVLALLTEYARTGDLRYRDLAWATGRCICESPEAPDAVRSRPAGMAALAWLTADPWVYDTVGGALDADPALWPVPRAGDEAAAIADALLARSVAFEWTSNPAHVHTLRALCDAALESAPADGVFWSYLGGGSRLLARDGGCLAAGWSAVRRVDPTYERSDDARAAAVAAARAWMDCGTVHEAGLLRNVYGLRREIVRASTAAGTIVGSDEMAEPGDLFAATLTMATAFAETGDVRFAEAARNLAYAAGAGLSGSRREGAAADALVYATQALALLGSRPPGR